MGAERGNYPSLYQILTPLRPSEALFWRHFYSFCTLFTTFYLYFSVFSPLNALFDDPLLDPLKKLSPSNLNPCYVTECSQIKL